MIGFINPVSNIAPRAIPKAVAGDRPTSNAPNPIPINPTIEVTMRR